MRPGWGVWGKGIAMKQCQLCKHSLAQLVNYQPLLMCLLWRRKAGEVCAEYEREPGTDDVLK